MAQQSRSPAITGERRYQALLDRITEEHRAVEETNLRRYHTIGSIFVEFLAGLDSNAYGDATTEKLAADLKERGVLGDIANPVRYLYWAKNLVDAYPDVQNLVKLGEMGFTISHAKYLFALDATLRPQVEAEMFNRGRMISVVALRDLITEKQQQRIAAANEEARRALESRAQGTGTGEVIDARAPADTTVADTTEEPPTETDQAEDGQPDVAPARPPGVPATGAPARERRVRDPMKKLGMLSKSLTQAAAVIPEVVMVVEDTAQNGFDSDTAFARYLDALRQVLAAHEAQRGALEALIERIQSEVNAAVLPAGE